MKLIVGLGNWQKKYLKNRHNAGFIVVDMYCKNNNIVLDEEKFDGRFAKKDNFIIAQPLTNMNLSGVFVRKITDFYKINYQDILIIYDDISFSVGEIKVKSSGSSGGQNGVASIIEQLNTTKIKRIKIGIDKNPKNILLGDYVLTDFSNDDLKKLQVVGTRVTEIINDFINDVAFDKIMSKWN